MIRLQTNVFKGCATSRCMVWSTRSTAFIIALALLAITPRLALSAGSIFDDDWKAPPPSKPPAPAYVPPPEPQAPPRLPPARPAPPDNPAPPDSPVPPPDSPVVKPPVGPAPEATPLRERAKVPADAALAPAEKLVKDAFKAEYSRATTPAGQIALARALFNEAQQSRDDPVTLYVLLKEAREMAANGGDPEIAVEAARGIRDAFQINHVAAGEMERDALMSAVKVVLAAPPAPVASPESRSAAYLTMAMAERELNAGNYAEAAQTAGFADQIAKKTNDPSLVDRVHGRAAVLSIAAVEYVRIKDQVAALKANPEDAAANLAVGRFHAFIVDRPEQAMPLLATGSDAALKALAEREIAVPATAADQLTLADAWAAAARVSAAGPIKEGMQRRALHWYDTASPDLPGLSRVAAQKKALDLRANNLKHGLLGEYYRGREFGFRALTRVDPRIEFNWRGLPPDDGMPGEEFSVRWTGWIKGGIAGQYKLVAIHDDGARIWIDGELVVDHWGDVGHETQTVHLTGGFQEIKIEYCQFGGQSNVGLGWVPPRATKAVAISSEALYHAPVPAGPVVAGRPGPDGDGKILLPAGAADLHNAGSARFVQNNEQMHIGGWENTSTWMSWDFDAPEGDYDVDINYACDGGNAGSQYVLSVGGNRITAKAADTGGWSSYTPTRLGRIRLAAGGQTLRLKATSKFHDDVMDVGQVILTPVK
ncbi:MAG: signaling protein [Phycisphaerales bacterium]|nr:signaling protein [Phycisphaerales bacterium]